MTNLGCQAGCIVSLKASFRCISSQNHNNPVSIRTDSRSSILSVVEISWVQGLCKVREYKTGIQVGNTSRHYRSVLCVGDIQMTFSQKTFIIGDQRFSAWHCIGARAVCTRLTLKLISYFLSKAFCIIILRKGIQIQWLPVAVNAWKKCILLYR